MLPPMLDNSIQNTAGSRPPAQGDAVHASRRRQKSRGQSMVEFAVLLPTLVIILALAADFGRALTAYIAISSAAREGAAYGMQSGETDQIEAIAKNDIGSGGSIWGTTVGVTSSVGPEAGSPYEQVVVTVSYSFTPIIPVPALPSTITMDRTVTMRVLN